MWTWAFGGPRPAILNPKRENGKTGKRENGKRENAKVSRQHPGHTLEVPPDVHLRVTAVCTQDTLTVHLQVPFWYFLGTP